MKACEILWKTVLISDEYWLGSQVIHLHEIVIESTSLHMLKVDHCKYMMCQMLQKLQ